MLTKKTKKRRVMNMELTVKQAAARLKVTPSRVRQLIGELGLSPDRRKHERGYHYILTVEHLVMMKARNRKGGRTKSNGGKN